jgi:hypothetical protein
MSCDAQICEQQGGGFRLHRTAAIGMQGELARRHVVLGDRVIEQQLEQGGAFCIGDAPADHAAAEDVEDDVEIEVAPLAGSHQLGDVPGPHFIGPFDQQFGFAVGRVTRLLAAFADLAVLIEDAVHGTDRAMVDAFIEQGGVDLGRRLIGEARCVQQVKHLLLLRAAQRRRRTLTRETPSAAQAAVDVGRTLRRPPELRHRGLGCWPEEPRRAAATLTCRPGYAASVL